MKIDVIAADEARDRQKFISKPLLRSLHDVSVLKTRPFNKFLYRLTSHLLKDAPDVVIFMGVGQKELFAYAFIKLARVPVVVRLGGDRLKDLESVAQSYWSNGRYLKWIRCRQDKYIAQYLLSRIDKAIVVNEALVGRVIGQLKAPGQIFVVPQFCEGAPVSRKYDIKEPIELLTVTNLRFSEKAKGVIWIIEQLDQIARSLAVAIHFQVAGAGLHLKDVKDRLELMDNSELLTVTLAGFVTELDDYYSSADIFVYNSLHDATPNVILESKRFSLPLLANRCEEFSNIIQHEVSGLLYRNAEEFQEFLKQIIEGQELREKIGQGARQEHKSKFSVEAIKVRIETALMSILQ